LLIVVWIAAFVRIDRRAVNGRGPGKAIALVFIALGTLVVLVSFLVP
jgi:hypothetical protein